MSETTPPPGLDTTREANGSKSNGTFSLENILGENHDAVEHPGPKHTQAATGWDEEETEKPLAEGYCVECEGVSPILYISNDSGSPPNHSPQTNLRRCFARLALMHTVKFALQPNTARDLGSNIQSNLCRRRIRGPRMVCSLLGNQLMQTIQWVPSIHPIFASVELYPFHLPDER